MRVLIAPGRYAGLLTAAQAAAALAAGWRQGAPHDEVRTLPLADGSGLVEVLAGALGGQQVVVMITDPLGRPVPATILRVEGVAGAVAFLDGSEALGEHLVAAHDRDHPALTTRGLGDLLLAASALDVDRIVVGLSGGVARDGGAGVLAALGVAPAALGRGGLALAQLSEVGAAAVATARARLAGIDLVVLTDEDLPLLGFHGVHARGTGQAPMFPSARGQDLESAVGHFVDLTRRALGTPDLLTGTTRRLDQQPGAGAGGGAGYAVLLLGGRRVPGAATVASLVGLRDALGAHDLVVTGTGRFDWAALSAGIVATVAASAGEHAVPAVLVAGESLVGRREAMNLGLSGTYTLADAPDERIRLLADPVGVLTDRAVRLARTWSPAR